MRLRDLTPWDPPDLTDWYRPFGPAPSVAVVIPARNAAKVLPDQLEALAAQDYDGPWEVVVVDDASVDETRAVAESYRGRLPRLRVLSDPTPLGPHGARNVGAAATDAEILCFCDADDRVVPGWVSSYVEALRDAPAAVGPMRPSDAPDRDTQPWKGTGLSHASSGNFAMRADVWRGLGGFRTDYPSHLAELDLSWRLQGAGLGYAIAPGAEIWYRIRDDLGAMWRQRVRWGMQQALARRLYGPRYMPHAGVVSTLRSYGWLVLHLPGLATREGRRRWIKTAGLRLGRALGSVRFRVGYL